MASGGRARVRAGNNQAKTKARQATGRVGVKSELGS